MALEQEWQTSQQELPRLLADESNRGKYALVRGARVDSVWTSMDEALAAGYERFGVDPFLVQEITDHQEPKVFSRNVTPCRS
jgi:hypothetical protein